MTRDAVVFRSKVDLWLAAILVIALLARVWSGIAAFRSDPGAAWLTLGGATLVTLFVAAVGVPTEYIVTERDLIVRSGFLRTAIPIDRIRSVRPTRNPLAAAAWSLDRLHIDYSGPGIGVALISPADKEGFMRALEERTNLVRSGTKLTVERIADNGTVR